jgi:putative transcriptional regulator
MRGPDKRLPVAQQIRKGLEEAIQWTRGQTSLNSTMLEMPEPPPQLAPSDLTALRHESEMSQAVFARLLNVSAKTVQSWEQGTRRPSQAALRLIQILRKDPAGVFAVVGLSHPKGHASPKRKKRLVVNPQSGPERSTAKARSRKQTA